MNFDDEWIDRLMEQYYDNWGFKIFTIKRTQDGATTQNYWDSLIDTGLIDCEIPEEYL